MFLAGQSQLRPGRKEDVLYALWRVLGVNRYVGRPRAQDSPDRNGQVHGPGQQQGNQDLRVQRLRELLPQRLSKPATSQKTSAQTTENARPMPRAPHGALRGQDQGQGRHTRAKLCVRDGPVLSEATLSRSLAVNNRCFWGSRPRQHCDVMLALEKLHFQSLCQLAGSR